MNRIASTFVVSLAFSASAFAQATAFRGTHVGFTTDSGTAGQQLQLRTGYGLTGAPESEQWSYRFQAVSAGVQQLQTRTARYASDPAATFDEARFNLWHGAPSNWQPSENGGGTSPVSGWYAQSTFSALHPSTERSTFNPTGGDAFIATGNLAGGSYAYEILSVVPLAGSPTASFALGQMVNPAGNTNAALRQLKGINPVGSTNFDTFGIYDASLAGGGSLNDRSIFLGNGNHFEGWGFFVSQKGLYEISMRVYDVNGVFASSDIFTFQVNSVPSASVGAAIGMTGLAASRRRRKS